MTMSQERFKQDLRLIVELEDEVNRATNWQQEQQWCKDRIDQLRFLYRDLERDWWPIVPGRGTAIEGECSADNQSEE
jgi:hypothetical protein